VTRVGARELISGLAVPLLREVGDRYARGELAVWQEHLASTRLREVLARIWRPLSDRAADAPVLVLATLPEELHDLGLHMAATWLSLAGYRIAFLGADTPVADIAATTRSLQARGVVIASSPAAPVEQVRVHLAELRERLPARVPLVVGGTEATSSGARRLDSLEDLDSMSWSRAH
jgi:methanogenic corrinoid protein MtbC1